MEAIVQGYLIGSGWLTTSRAARCLRHHPAGRLAPGRSASPALFTPSTKAALAAQGKEHRLRPDPRSTAGDPAHQVRDAALAIYAECAAYARGRGAGPSPTPSSRGARSGRGQPPAPDRRGRDPQLLPLPGRRTSTGPASAPTPTAGSSATTWRPWTGARPRRAQSTPRTSST